METNHFSCTRTGCTNLEKTMEDGKFVNANNEKNATPTLSNPHIELPAKLTANGHDFAGEPSNLPEGPYDHWLKTDAPPDEKVKKRINPLRIHLGKRPFVDNSLSCYNLNKKKKPYIPKGCEKSTLQKTAVPRIHKSIPKSQFHNISSQFDNNAADSEKDKPVPRLVPKSQFQHFKRGKIEKGPQLKQYAQSLGLQPMVKFKCRKCCSMSFKTLAMLKEHQLVCRAQAKEPALSPVVAPSAETNAGGPSRVTRKVYLCSACGTYYENWNLFLHMREIHNRHICLFCLGMFSKAEKLSSHLTNKHNVQEFNYDSKEDFLNVYNGTLYLMCCVCDEICSEKDDFFNHDCNNVKPKPVPVLVSKSSIKPNNATIAKVSTEVSTNGPVSVTKEVIKPVTDKPDKKDIEQKPEIETSKVTVDKKNVPVNSDIVTCTENSVTNSKDSIKTINSVDSGMELNSTLTKSEPSPQHNFSSPEENRNTIPNDDESSERSDGHISPVPDVQKPLIPETLVKHVEPVPLSIEKEKEGGIKLKLSLNSASSPVIINSTVDPSIGKHNIYKPPSRVRRPPKRYEKEKPTNPIMPTVQPRTPSIKMTICDKAESPFVKTTIYENVQESSLKTLFNNNLENTLKNTEVLKPENTIKTTIYDNKVDEDINTFNRVPKLTVRVPKELLDKDSSSDYSSDSDASDKLTVDDKIPPAEDKIETKEEPTAAPEVDKPVSSTEEVKEETISPKEEVVQILEEATVEAETELSVDDISVEAKPECPVIDETPVTELTLDRPLDKYPLKELLKVFLASTVFNCIYCNHVRKIAVNCKQLCLHMAAQHRFSATVDSITAEELMPETITSKVKTGAEELCSIYINLDSYDSVDKCEDYQYDHQFECFQCYFKTAVHKDLYLHNRKMHQKTILLCVMCKTNFYSYSELLCHLCPGTYDSEYEIKFRCCLCNVDSIPSSFRLMVHLRKVHHTCDVCLEFCHSQALLSNHVWKHKLHHLCYRCGIAYRNKPDITKHLFWKHGTESIMCKRCLQKKWPHIYHFCTPPVTFACDECSLKFTKAVYLKVHKRLHTEEYPHVCSEEACTEKFVSKKLLMKHLDEHRKKLFTEDLNEEKPSATKTDSAEITKEPIPVIDLVDDKPKEEAGSSEAKTEVETAESTKKIKKKKQKEKDALLLDVNLPALNLSESDSSDESDSGVPPPDKENIVDETTPEVKEETKDVVNEITEITQPKEEIQIDIIEPQEEKPDEKQVLDIWDNFKKYQAKVEKQKEKSPLLMPIRKHVCESDHDYCLIPTDLNGEKDLLNLDKKKNKKSPKKRHGGLSSSSSSSDSDSSCSCGSNCSCSSSSGSSSSSSDSDSSDISGNEKKKRKQKKSISNRRLSNGSNVDVMGVSETPILIPEKIEPFIAETDLETEESDTDEEFYDEHPQRLANKLYAEKRNQLMLLASVAPSDGGSMSGDVSRCTTPTKEKKELKTEATEKDKRLSSKKKSKKKKKSRSSRKHGPIKINIPKDIVKNHAEPVKTAFPPNKITISLQSKTVQIPESPAVPVITPNTTTPASSLENKRASKRRRVPNKFYGYSSDEESSQTPAALKPQQPPKLEWRKEDLPSPVTHKVKKEVPSTTLSNRLYNYTDSLRLTAPIPDPEPPRILMNSESMDSSDSDSSDEGALEIFQPSNMRNSIPVPAPTYLNSGTSSLPYVFQRPPVRQAREGESVYCYCRCPYDEVSEMIACDAEGCPIEWFHFECVGIMVPPKGKWYCPECRKNQSFSGYR